MKNMNRMPKKKVCIVTTTRADWGLLMPIAMVLKQSPTVELQIVASNMHLSERCGMTVNEIISAGFEVNERVAMPDAGESEADCVRAMSVCLKGMADAFERLRPDVLLILGDRYEILTVASAATVMRIPIIHIAGGAISQGAIDDNIRHAVTKLSTLHLTETEVYRQRVIQMGEAPERVICTGAIGVWNAMNQPLMSVDELSASLDFDLAGDVAVVTYHPATADVADPAEGCRNLLAALDRLPQLKTIITYPNNDARSLPIIELLKAYAEEHSDRVRLFKSLGMRRYLSALQVAKVVIGNSSSGIVEVPSTGAVTVNIGSRQDGRLAAESVLNCSTDSQSIYNTIVKALSPQMQSLAARRENPYYKPDTLGIMTDAIIRFAENPVCVKTFYDINVSALNR
jgi:UDP-hydrolysing UDP-N-acetyl-D-glucosamine 2-epimerase